MSMLREKKTSLSDLRNVRMRFVPTPVPQHLISAKYTDLLNRNDELIFELTKLKMDYRSLQKQYNAVILERIAVKPELKDASVQTERDATVRITRAEDLHGNENYSESDVYFEKFFTPAKMERTFGGSQVPKKKSPATNRLFTALTKRLEDERKESLETLDPIIQDIPQLPPRREMRDRKSIIYTEPSLKVKVRKGFQFFKTREDKK